MLTVPDNIAKNPDWSALATDIVDRYNSATTTAEQEHVAAEFNTLIAQYNTFTALLAPPALNMPLIKKAVPRLISCDIISVQPMSAPSGTVHCLKGNNNDK